MSASILERLDAYKSVKPERAAKESRAMRGIEWRNSTKRALRNALEVVVSRPDQASAMPTTYSLATRPTTTIVGAKQMKMYMHVTIVWLQTLYHEVQKRVQNKSHRWLRATTSQTRTRRSRPPCLKTVNGLSCISWADDLLTLPLDQIGPLRNKQAVSHIIVQAKRFTHTKRDNKSAKEE